MNLAPQERITILYIAATPRSGSTVLCQLFGQLLGYWPAGEVIYLWNKGLGFNETCSCGRPFRDCPFWQAVLRNAGLSSVDVGAVREMRRAVERWWLLPWLLGWVRWRVPTGWRGRCYTRYQGVLTAIYRSLAATSGCRVVVDASKSPLYLAVLRRNPTLDVRTVHLVRDSRAVAWSWQRKVWRPEVRQRIAYMVKYPIGRASGLWLWDNLVTELVVVGQGQASTRLRYEDLCADPSTTVRHVLKATGLASVGDHLSAFDTLTFAGAHIAAGNPVRFQLGDIPVREDGEWRDGMAKWLRCLVAWITSPLLTHYGYKVRP